MKLNQTIAIEADAKKHAAESVSLAIGAFGRPQLFAGVSRTYQSKDDEGERLPAERSEVQYRLDQVVRKVADDLSRAFDLAATKDVANCEARADVTVGGKVLLENLPATHLLYLEKQLAELESFFKRVPTLDPAQRWSQDSADGLWKTAPVETVRSKKVPQVLVKYEATDRHPAQTEVWYEDAPVGTWMKVEASGAWPLTRVETIIGRIRELQAAVKTAREQANGVAVTEQRVGEAIFAHLLA